MNRMKSALFLIGFTAVAAYSQMNIARPAPPLSADQLQVMSIEEQFRAARLHSDVTTLDRILADDYTGTNQYGVARNKADMKELFKTFKLKSLTLAKTDVKVHGDTAVVTGTQTETIPDPPAPSRMRFVRVYVKQDGRWQLLTSEQLPTTQE
jgi:ketosteroid isomerase-like protein